MFFEQTFQNFEILLIDNGSTDNTREIYENYPDKRLRYIFQEGSGGPASPRNTGIKNAHGEWICFLDSDDKWVNVKLEVIKETIESYKDLDVICHNEYILSLDSKTLKTVNNGPASGFLYKDMLLYGNRLSTSAVAIKRQFIINRCLTFNEENNYMIVEDYDFWLRVAHAGGKFHFIKKNLGYYIFNSDNLIFNDTLYYKNLRYLLHDHVYKIQNITINKDQLWCKVNIRFLLVSSLFYLRKKNIFMFFIMVIKAFYCSPSWFIEYLKYKFYCRGRI